MTDKQIIIDGVDVSGCKESRYYDNTYHCDLCHTEKTCKDFPNCYYKQLKRKEQECEEYKKKLDNIQDSCPASVDCSYRQCDKDRIAELKKELSSLLAEKNALEIGRDEYKQECQLLKQALKNQNIVAIVEENDQLKAENEELKTQYNCYSCGNCKGREDYINMARHCENAIKTNHKYKQALDEIEEYTIKQFCDNCEEIGSTELTSHCEFCEYNETLDIINKAKE